MIESSTMTKAQVLYFLMVEKEQRERYFGMFAAEKRVLEARASMTEEMQAAGRGSRFTELVLDTLLATAFSVGDLALNAAIDGFVSKIIGTRAHCQHNHRSQGT